MKNSKFVNVLFLAAGGIVWLVVRHYLEYGVSYFQLPRRLGPDTADVIRHGVPIIFGALTYFLLRRNTKISHFVSDSADELVRVVFPGPREVRIGTVWVIILVVLAGLIFGALDWGITSVIKTVIGIRS